jgi:hypothetical protein
MVEKPKPPIAGQVDNPLVKARREQEAARKAVRASGNSVSVRSLRTLLPVGRRNHDMRRAPQLCTLVALTRQRRALPPNLGF